MSKYVLWMYHFALILDRIGFHRLGSLVNFLFVRIPFGCQIGLGASFGRGCILGYGGLGVVIHKNCKIADFVTIGSNVTLGGAYHRIGVPSVGANTIISTGAKLIGAIHVGHDCVVGANAVVLKDVPAHSVVAGIPARVIKSGIDILDYRNLPDKKGSPFDG